MALGYPAKTIRKKEAAWVLPFAIAVWCGFHWLSFHLVSGENWEREFAYNRIAAASGILTYESERFPEPVRKVFRMDRESLLKDVEPVLLAGEKHGEFPDSAVPSWALMFHLLGESGKAEQLIEETRAREPTSKINDELDLVSALIERKSISNDLHRQFWQEYSQTGSSWPVWHYFRVATDDMTIRSWLSSASLRMISRGIFADLLMVFTGIVALLALLLIVMKRSEIPSPVFNHRLHRWWNPGACLAHYCLSLVAASLVVWTLYSIPAIIPESYTSIILLSSFVFILLPLFWMVYRFTPGWIAAARLFGLTDQNRYPLRWMIGFGLSGALLMYLIGLITSLSGLESLLRSPEDWLRPNMLDNYFVMLGQLFLASCVVPVAEEVIYRGFLFGCLMDRLGNKWAAVISSAIFATAHWYTLGGWFLIFIDGLIFCYLYRKTGSLWTSVIAHGVLNLILTSSVISWYSLR